MVPHLRSSRGTDKVPKGIGASSTEGLWWNRSIRNNSMATSRENREREGEGGRREKGRRERKRGREK